MMKCQFCGSDNESWYVYCQNCGKKLARKNDREASPEVETKTDPTAGPPSVQDSNDNVEETREASHPIEQTPLKNEEFEKSGVLSTARSPAASTPPPFGPDSSSDLNQSSLEDGSGTKSVICSRCQESIPVVYSYCGFCGFHLDTRQVPRSVFSPKEGSEPFSSTKMDSGISMLLRVREDGTVESGFSIREGETIIGRENGDIIFPSDSLMSKRHALLGREERRILLQDLNSTNGTFLRLQKKTSLSNGDHLLIGKQLLRFDSEASEGEREASSAEDDQTLMLGSLVGLYDAKLVKILPNGKDGNEYPLTEETSLVGREQGDLTFKNDPYVSAKHAKIEHAAGAFTVEDLQSSNGTYLRLRGRVELERDDFFIVGEQLFQVR